MFQQNAFQQDAFQVGESGSGASADVPNTAQLSTIEMGQVAITAAGLGGVIQE